MNTPPDDIRGPQRPLSAPPDARRYPMRAIVIGVVAGAVLGIGLAQGILSIVAWRRDVRRQEQEAADTVAAEQLLKDRQARDQKQEDSQWFRWATEKRDP